MGKDKGTKTKRVPKLLYFEAMLAQDITAGVVQH